MTTHNASGSTRPVVARSFAGIAIVVVAATALAVSGRAPARATAQQSASTASSAAPPSTAPVAPPVATPVPTTKPAEPTPRPTTAPTHENIGEDATPIKVDLETFDRHAVYVDIVDQTGLLESAVSGRPGDNPTAEGLAVENVDARTLRLTWVDFPIDNADALSIEWFDGHLRLMMVQPEPRGVTDAVGFDRELILTFAEPISAADVEALLTTGLDT